MNSDIKKIIQAVLNIEPSMDRYEDDFCPFCGEWSSRELKNEGKKEMEAIKHEINCAYLLAKKKYYCRVQPRKA